MNSIFIWVLRIIIVGLYVYHYYRYSIAKKMDPSIALKFNLRSKIELIVVALANLVLIMYPVQSEQDKGVAVFIGSILLIITFYQLGRMVLVGRKLLFAKQHMFECRLINRKSLSKGKFSFSLKGGTVDVRFPIGDMEYVMQVLSGAYRRHKHKK